MIRISPYNTVFNARINHWEEREEEYAAFILHPNNEGLFYSIYDGTAFIGVGKIEEIEDTSILSFYIGYPSKRTETVFSEVVDVLSNRAIKVYTHNKLVCNYYGNTDIKQALSMHLYYEKGTYMQRLVEPFRRRINNAAFDDHGYIINQGMFKDIPFGHYNTKAKGCGWIAAYNLLKMCDKEKTLQEVEEALSKDVFLHALLGQGIFKLNRYLRENGLQTHFTKISRKNCIEAAKRSEAGIILYTHTRGSHYVTYRKDKNDFFIFYNAVYGLVNQKLKFEDFLKKYSFLPFTMLLWVEKNDNFN